MVVVNSSPPDRIIGKPHHAKLSSKMTSNDLTVRIADGGEAELLTDVRFGILQGTVKLEERVTRLFELLREPVYHYLLVIFRSPAEAEDITQETFLQLYKHLHDGERIENVRFWIFRVAHNLAINRQKRERIYELLAEPTWEDIRERLVDSALDPEQLLLWQEKMQRLHAAMAWLSSQERQCLHLRAEGFRYREIGEILGIATPSVAEFLRRGIRKLMRSNNG
jgi:RNA polymerase sigma-70 factor, ECF subfamily